ncbi:hypothetical protein ACEPAG_6867 [Sanghuangporus baumii]
MAVSNTIPRVQRALVLPKLGVPLKLVSDYPVVAPSDLLPGQCLVKRTHSGVCHSDFALEEGWFAKDLPPKEPLIGGHEGVGSVIGDRVGITVLVGACGKCEFCVNGEESYCSQVQSSGCSVDGTFREYTVVPVDFVIPIPDALKNEEAGPIMCAGYTVYSALRQCDAHIGNWVAIPGAGGGLGHLAVQYAVTMGLRVVAIDSGEEKRKLVLGYGAEKWIDYEKSKDLVSDVLAATEGGAHAAVIIAGSTAVYSQAVGYLRNRATLVAVGVPKDGIYSIPLVLLTVKGITVCGILIGNRQCIKEAVQLAAIGKVKCQYTVRGLSELDQVYEELEIGFRPYLKVSYGYGTPLEKGTVAGRIVLDISK